MPGRGRDRLHPVAWPHAAVLALALAALPAGGSGEPAPVALAVVVNDAHVENDLPMSQLRRIFLGDRRFWSDGQPIHGVLPPKDAPELTEEFLREVLGLTPDEFWRHWKANSFRGLNTRTPRSLSSTSITLRAVLRSTVPIALVPADRLPARTLGLRVLTVDGKSPDDPDYPLRLAPRGADGRAPA